MIVFIALKIIMLPKHKRLTAKKNWNHFVQTNKNHIAQLIALLEDPVKTPEQYVENFQKLNQIMSVLQTSENLMLVQESATIKVPMGQHKINLFQVYELVIHYYFEFYVAKREEALAIHPTLITELVSFIKNLSWCSLHVSSYHEVFQLLVLYIKHTQLESSLEQELLLLVEELFQKVCEKVEDLNLNNVNLKDQAYTLMLSLYIVLHEKYPDQRRWLQFTAFFERMISQKIDLSYTTYVNLLYLFAKKETPNLNYIGYVFGKLYGHLLYLKNDGSLDKEALHDFTFAISSYYKAIAKWSERMEAMAHKEAVLKKESLDQMLFISERIMNLNFIKLPQMPLEHWHSLLSILVVHRHMLSEKQQEKIYSIAQYVLNCLEFNPESPAFLHFTQKSKLLSLCFNLIANTKNPRLAAVKPIYDAFQSRALQGDDYNAGYDEVVRILLKAKQFTCADMQPLFESLIKQRPDKKMDLLCHIMTEAEPNDAQYLSLINAHIDVIMMNKPLFNTVVRRLNQEQIRQLEQALLFEEEGKHLLTWQTKQALRVQEVETMDCLPSFKKAKAIYRACLQREVGEWGAEYLPSEWSGLQQQLGDEFSLLHELVSEAKRIDLNANRFILEFVQTLQQQTIDIQRLVNNRQTALQEIATEKDLIAEARQRWVSINEARELVKSNNYEQLVRIHRGFIITAESFESHLIKIKTLLKLGYNYQALMWLQQTQLQFPEQKSKELMIYWADYYKAIGDYYSALNVYEQLSQFKSTPLQQAYTKLNKAWCHQQSGKETGFDWALSLYDELLSEDTLPRSTILQAKVRCLLASNRLAQAQELMKELSEQEDARFYALMASFHLQQGHYKEAVEHYKKALARENHLGWIRALLHCYTADSSSDKEEMQRWMASLLQKVDNSQEGQAVQVIIYIKMKQYNKALECIDLIRQEYGPSQFICIQIALCYRKMGQINAAIAELNSFAWHFKNQQVLKHLAITYSLANRSIEALQCFDYLLAEYPLFVSAYINAFAFTMKTQQIDKLKWYWQLYQEQFGQEIGAIPPELYSSLQYHLFPRTVDSCLPLKSEELDAFIAVELEADEALKTLNLREETLICLENLQRTKINPRYFDVPVANADARYSSLSIAALDLAFFTPKRVQSVQVEESNRLSVNTP